MDEISDEYETNDKKSYDKCLEILEDMLLFMKDFKPEPRETPRVEIIIVPIPNFGVSCELSKYEGTLRERCKKRKRTSRRRREFEAAKAHQKSS